MDQGEHGSDPGVGVRDTGIDEYLQSIESGNYRRTVDSVLSNWSAWVEENRSVEALEEISVMDCRTYARHLKTEVRENTLKASTANTYYSVIRAFLEFCVDEELINSNPAAVKRAADELPSESGTVERQFWGEEERQQFLDYLDNRARRSLEEEIGVTRLEAFRDRALIYVLALSGVRGGEILKDPADDKRNGVSWNDTDLENGTIRVFGKSREYEYAQVPEQAVAVLKRYRKVLTPETGEWPVFPSNHSPLKYRELREQTDVEVLEEVGVDEAIREHGVIPPSLSKNGCPEHHRTALPRGGY